MLTRAGVAKRLGRSIATVRRLEGTELHPWTDARGVHQFDDDEVEQLARNDRDRDPAPKAPTERVTLDTLRRVEQLELELATAHTNMRAASQHGADLETQNRELRTTAIEALELVQVLLGTETPYAVRRCLRDLERHR